MLPNGDNGNSGGPGRSSLSLFQGTGKRMNALFVTILRTLILIPIFADLFAFNFDMGLTGIWWGLVAANVIGSAVAFIWARLYVQRLVNLKRVGERSDQKR